MPVYLVTSHLTYQPEKLKTCHEGLRKSSPGKQEDFALSNGFQSENTAFACQNPSISADSQAARQLVRLLLNTPPMKSILIIDDQDDIRSVTAAALVVAGYTARGAKDGREGIVKVLAQRPDLILCDIKMPGMDGYRTLEAIRKFPHTSDIPFIMMTGSVVGSEFRRAMNCGADDYLAKPFTADQLIAAVKSRLARQSKSQQEIKLRVRQIVEHETRFAFRNSTVQSA
jgi:CheY-like chemotaxis protein